jgi:hypothetical protein
MGTTNEVSMTFETYGQTSLERFVACAMIAMIPNEGLEEALYSLRDMLSFYREDYSRLPSIQRLPETVDATVVAETKRSDLLITQ